MSKDRYEELRAVRKFSSTLAQGTGIEESDKNEKPEMYIFYDKVSEIEDRISKVNDLVLSVHALHEKNLNSLDREREKESTIEIDRQSMEISIEINSIKAKLIGKIEKS
ncbi:hypothetical protein AYI69_g4623 [Smittium culicis]|uniref:Uncharacterized protein n=1 Tax=Smittium culicis TaxID=133412 RepID=A0A1R1YC27_9FUNG|nr:hypothetical protein AYI69_g4623 [Smittium culicis]